MAFNINDLTAYFDNPAVSRFDRSRKHESDCNIGPMIPHNWDLLNFGNSAKGKTYHAMRLAPMLAPNFSDLQLQEHTAVVPLRVIMKNYEEVLNYAENVDGSTLPHFTSKQYHSLLYAMTKCELSPIGSLLDYMRYPVYADLFNCQFTDGFSIELEMSDGTFYDCYAMPLNKAMANDEASSYNNDMGSTLTFIYRSQEISKTYLQRQLPSLFQYALLKRYDRVNYYDIDRLYNSLGRDYSSPISIDDIVSAFNLGTVTSLVKSYQNFIFSVMLDSYLGLSNRYNSAFNDKPNITALPLMAYHRFHYDWNTNGNFTDRDELLESNVFSFVEKVNLTVTSILNGNVTSHNTEILKELLYPHNRLWSYDFFTSLLPTSAVDNAIEIPANSTVLDLAKLTAFQKLVLKLSYSSRYRDVVWNVFKIRPSDARLQQSSVISRRYHNIGIGETLQTSATDTSSVLGDFAGRGYSAGKGDMFHVFCEEPCILLNIYSFVPTAVFADAVDPLIHVDDIFDMPIPDMDVLGNMPIYTDFLTGNQLDSNAVFGYGRQYQEWLSNYSTVHGSFKTTLKYWQLSRRFETVPALNDDFLRINDSTDFDEIFSVPESSQAMIKIVTNYEVTRHVHRSVRIQI